MAALVAQSKTAISVPLDHVPQGMVAGVILGDIYQLRILEGEISAQAAAEELTRQVNEQFGLNEGGN